MAPYHGGASSVSLVSSVPHVSPPGAAAQGAVPAAQHCHQGAQEGRARLVAALPAPAKAVDGLERRRWTVAFFAWVPSARTRASSKTARRAAEHSLLPLDSHMPGRHPNVRRVGERCRVCAHVCRVWVLFCVFEEPKPLARASRLGAPKVVCACCLVPRGRPRARNTPSALPL